MLSSRIYESGAISLILSYDLDTESNRICISIKM